MTPCVLGLFRAGKVRPGQVLATCAQCEAKQRWQHRFLPEAEMTELEQFAARDAMLRASR
jgi:hypothetical protein